MSSKNIFNELHNFWGIADYDEDHIIILLQRENRRLVFNDQSPQIEYRTTLVDWMKKIAVLKKLDNSSVHLAVYLLDVFMDSYNINLDRLHLIALVSLLLATKFEERDSNILKVNEVNDLVNNKYAASDYYSLEILMLQHMQWSLMIPTSVHFVNAYIEFLFTNEDFKSLEYMSVAELWFEARRIIQLFMEVVLDDIKLMQAKPSMVASAIMASTRSALKLTMIWPSQLNCITGYKLFELKVLMLKFLNVKNKIINKIL